MTLGALVSCFLLVKCQLAADLLKAGLQCLHAQECCTMLKLSTAYSVPSSPHMSTALECDASTA